MSRPRLLFHAGGECLERYGSLVRATSVAESSGYTFTRTGTASMISPTGLISAGANIPRIEWRDGVPYMLLERSGGNVVPSLDVSAWDDNGTPVVTGGQADPFGGTGAYLVEDDDGAANDFKRSTVFTFASTGGKNASIFIKEPPTPGLSIIKLRDTTASADIWSFTVSGWTAGVPTLGSVVGSFTRIIPAADGWYEIQIRSLTATAGNDHRIEIAPAGYTASNTGQILVYWPQQETSDFSSSLMPAASTRGSDNWSTPIGFGPQALTGYVDFLEGFPPSTAEQNSLAKRVLQIGSTTGGWLAVSRSSSTARYNVSLSGSTAAQTSATVAYRDRVRLAWWLYDDGSYQIANRVNSGAWTTGTRSAASTMPTAWSANTLSLNSIGSAGYSIGWYHSVKIAAGTYTPDEMESA
jgi:hypothetical protein